MTFAILIGVAAILFSAGYILQRQRIDTLEFRGGRIRPVRGQALVEKSGSNKREEKH